MVPQESTRIWWVFRPQGWGRRGPIWTSWNIENIPYEGGLLQTGKFYQLVHPVFYVHMTVRRNKFLYDKNQQTHSLPNLFWYTTQRVSGSFSACPQELATVHSAQSHVIQG